MTFDVVVLAAGEGQRLRSKIPKPLLPLAGKPLISYVLETARKLAPQQLVVVCPPASEFTATLRQYDTDFIRTVQATPSGTADALRCALPHLARTGCALVLCADAPLLSVASLRKLLRAGQNAPALLTFTTDTPTGYGRIVRDKKAVCRIVEQRDASTSEQLINEVYAGAMALPTKLLKTMLEKIDDQNAAGERYITDIAALATAQGLNVSAVQCSADECAGVNTAADLEHLTRLWRQQQSAALLARGVRLADANRVDVRGTVRCGTDVEIDVNVILEGDVALADDCRIGANCILKNCRIGANTVIAPFSHIEDSIIGERCTIGPYARMRPGSVLAAGVHVGNFVEIKNSRLKENVKAGHLAYIGDSNIGTGSNIGAGVITCNYDGKEKHRTVIGNDVFIGSDSQLVAPVKIADGAYIAAGSTITKTVPANNLAISRTPQQVRPRKKS